MTKLKTGFVVKCSVALMFWTSAMLIAAPCTTFCRKYNAWGSDGDIHNGVVLCWKLGVHTAEQDFISPTCVDGGHISAGVENEECKATTDELPKLWYKNCADECTGGDFGGTIAKNAGTFVKEDGTQHVKTCKEKLEDDEPPGGL